MNNGSRSAYWGDQDINLDGLNGNRAVVTGGAQGLGLAIAASLGRTGARIVLADIDVERADRIALLSHLLPGATYSW